MRRHWEESNDEFCGVCGGVRPSWPIGTSRAASRAAGKSGSGQSGTQAGPNPYTRATKGQKKETQSNPTRAQLQEPKAHARGERSGPEDPTKERSEGKKEERKIFTRVNVQTVCHNERWNEMSRKKKPLQGAGIVAGLERLIPKSYRASSQYGKVKPKENGPRRGDEGAVARWEGNVNQVARDLKEWTGMRRQVETSQDTEAKAEAGSGPEQKEKG
ncbi:hypothetical protein B0H13DRAFT_1887360 [Mycena leptocephala]|nr:hypothetical protein B0H13DRAFT_1887360 [Mycena leptocephala]